MRRRRETLAALAVSWLTGCRCISKEELEQALKEKGLLDGRDIKDIISEVDADNVSRSVVVACMVMMMVSSRPSADRLLLLESLRRTGGSTTASSWR
jgi:hypothetical protein